MASFENVGCRIELDRNRTAFNSPRIVWHLAVDERVNSSTPKPDARAYGSLGAQRGKNKGTRKTKVPGMYQESLLSARENNPAYR